MSEVSKSTLEYARKLQAKSRRARRRMFIIAPLALALAGAAGYGGYRWYDAHRQRQAVRTIVQQASAQANPRDSLQQIREAVDAGQITRDQAREAMMEMREAAELKRLDEFFALPSGKPRTDYLDKIIREEEERFAEWERRAATRPAATRPATGPDGWRGRGPDGDPPTEEQRRQWEQRRNEMMQRMQERRDAQPPEYQVKRAEFRAALLARRAQLGLPERERGPWRGGPWGPGGRGGEPRGGGEGPPRQPAP